MSISDPWETIDKSIEDAKKDAIPVDWIVNFKNSTKAGALMGPKEVINFMHEAWKDMLEAWREEQEGD